MDFSQALTSVKLGSCIAREGWNGKGMFLFLVPGSHFRVSRHPLLGIFDEGTEIDYCPHIDMRTADGKIVPWLASQTDLLADDWVVVQRPWANTQRAVLKTPSRVPPRLGTTMHRSQSGLG